MVHSQWICNTCGQGFDKRGKRDNHQQSEHRRQIMVDSIDQEQQQVERSESGKFECACGKGFLHGRSLKRHRIGCNATNLIIESPTESSENEEGTRRFPS